jgi:carboxylate-amine ligase
MDIQECPTADMAIVTLVIETLKAFVKEKFISLDQQMKMKTDPMATLFERCYVEGQKTEVVNPEYLAAFGMSSQAVTAKNIWQSMMNKLVKSGNTALEKWTPELSVILNEGTLSDRILSALNGDHSEESIKTVYRRLSGCLEQNKMFIP